MWKEYYISNIKNNKATSVSVMVAAFISSMFMSLITSVFYNMWIDNINRNADGAQPTKLVVFYIFVITITCIALILIIRNAFLVSMQSRLHQLGILQSIGATPRQIRLCLLQEAFTLCLIPILTGIGAGVALCIAFVQYANRITGSYNGENAVFIYHFALFLLSLFVSMFTVLYSAWLPARRLSRMSPLQVINGEDEKQAPVKIKKFRFISLLFGIEGELARKSLYVRRKALRTTTLSLTLSFFAFSIFLSFITLSGISTQYTYFERYKDAWDIMGTVENQNINDIENVLDIDALSQVESCIIYQKAMAYTWISEDMLSENLRKLGGIPAVTSDIAGADMGYKVMVPIVILDDKSFQSYCEDLGLTGNSTGQGMVTINRIWDSINSNFRYKSYIPFIREQDKLILPLYQDTEEGSVMVKVPVITFTDKVPVLREEYENYSLVQIVSADTWQNLMVNMNVEPMKVYINLLTATDEYIRYVQTRLEQSLKGKTYEIENRIDENIYNQEIKKGYTLIIGGLCVLLALIGLANMFSNALGYIYHRRREFARYISIGLTPKGIRKILCMEALIIAGKPILITLPLTVLFVIFASDASYIDPKEFVENMPLIPFIIFISIILSGVGLAYYMGGRRICRGNIVESLKNDVFS